MWEWTFVQKSQIDYSAINENRNIELGTYFPHVGNVKGKSRAKDVMFWSDILRH